MIESSSSFRNFFRNFFKIVIKKKNYTKLLKRELDYIDIKKKQKKKNQNI